MILNLKHLNEYVAYHHFKMETFEAALKLVKPNSYMASVDLRHAYYMVNIAPSDRKFLRFIWREEIFEFSCLPNGLSSAPRIYTKLLKPVFATLRQYGYKNTAYIDDSFLIEDNKLDCKQNVHDTVILLKHLGFIIHDTKSVLEPCQKLTFLGNVIDSEKMLVFLPDDKVKLIKDECLQLFGKNESTIRNVARIIGLLVSSFQAVEFGPLHYRNLEREKILALKRVAGNFDSKMVISPDMKQDLLWWIDNIHEQYRVIDHGNPDFSITSDASLKGWGAVKHDVHIGGRWKCEEADNNINFLELLAIFYALKSFCKDCKSVHVQILSDNSSAIAYIRNFGGIKSDCMNELALRIWNWCCSREIWISAEHVPGKTNQADKDSREFNENIEWMLNREVFENICSILGKPTVDLFATRLNTQLNRFISWSPDPDAEKINAFSFAWNIDYYYLFPPFSLISRCVQKINRDHTDCLMILPLWPTQIWYSAVMELLVDFPLVLPHKQRLLLLPETDKIHPLIKQMTLIACRLSGNPMKSKEFRKKLRTLSQHLGEKVLKNSILSLSEDGYVSVAHGKLIPFNHL